MSIPPHSLVSIWYAFGFVPDTNTPQVIKAKIILSDAYLVNALYVFDITGENYLDSLNVDKGAYLVLLFKEKSNCFAFLFFYVVQGMPMNNFSSLCINILFRRGFRYKRVMI